MPQSGLTQALVAIGHRLKAADYRFVTPSPQTHALVNGRPGNELARDWRDVFGWSRPFAPDLLPPDLLEILRSAGLLIEQAGRYKSAVRFSSLGPDLLAHSAFPTGAADAIFFGPDTYRFAYLIRRTVSASPRAKIVRALDLGCGGGAGGLVLARLVGRTLDLILSDINRNALDFARANFRLAGQPAPALCHSDLYAGVDGSFDLVVSNPPYLNDGARRAYRHGGGAHGEALSLRILDETLPRLNPDGRLVLYTGVAVIGGDDPIRGWAAGRARDPAYDVQFEEIDPDVFGEELANPAYLDAERIAAVAVVVTRR